MNVGYLPEPCTLTNNFAGYNGDNDQNHLTTKERLSKNSNTISAFIKRKERLSNDKPKYTPSSKNIDLHRHCVGASCLISRSDYRPVRSMWDKNNAMESLLLIKI